MKRRSYLVALTAGLAGCTSGPSLGGSDDDTSENGTADTLTVGDETVTDDGIRIVLEEVSVTDHLETRRYSYEDVDSLFVLIEVSAENVADGPQSLPKTDEIQLVADGQQFDTSVSGEVLSLPDSDEGEPYTGVDQARTGVESRGWLVFRVPRDVSAGTLSWHRGGIDDEEVTWEFDIDTSGFSHFELTGIDLPQTATVGQPIEIDLTIANNGGSEGTIDLIALFEYPGAEDEREWTLTIPAGESVTRSVTLTVETDGELGVHVLEPFSASKWVTIEE